MSRIGFWGILYYNYYLVIGRAVLGDRIRGTFGDKDPLKKILFSRSHKWGVKKDPLLRGLPNATYDVCPFVHYGFLLYNYPS